MRDDLRKLRTETENKKDKINQISKEDYQIICDKYKINESEAKTVLLFWHRTGFLYYDENLSKNIILNQTWAIEAIYEALRPKGEVKKAKGIIKYEDLKDFWTEKADKKYTETEVKTFIDFMVSSEICFCKEQQYYKDLENPTFIVPHYLPKPANSFTRWRYEKSFYLKYKPAFFHKGIAERFLSRLGRLSNDNDLWRNGIRIFSETLKAEALITFDKCKTDEKQKEVFIRSENYELLEEIKKELNKILDEGSQTKPSEKVAFFYSLDGNSFVSKKNILHSIKSEGKLVENTEGIMTELNPFLEKYQLGSIQKVISKESDFEKEGKQNETLLMKEANNKKNPIIMKEEKSLKIFISYCSYDRELRETFENRLKVCLQSTKNKFENLWSDIELKVGDNWNDKIQKVLNESTIGILLVSPDFLASKYCTGDELTVMLNKQEDENYLIVPVLLSDCSFANNEVLSKLQFFKTYKSEYDINELNEMDKLMPLDNLIDVDKPRRRLVSRYFTKLAKNIDDAVDILR